MINITAICVRLTAICDWYEKTSPEVSRWADDLYRRIHEDSDHVVLSEIRLAERLLEEGLWMPANYAQNQLYHLTHRLGRPVGLMADY